jgi:hypothetical protein
MQTAMHVIPVNGYNLHRAAEIIAKAQLRVQCGPRCFALCAMTHGWLSIAFWLYIYCMLSSEQALEECIDFQEAVYKGSVNPLSKM